MAMILITGATGTVGKELVQQLSAAGVKARALVRHPEQAAAIRLPGIDLVKGDMAEPASLDAALRGVERAFLLSAPEPRQVELQANFIHAAKRAGVQHIVKLSAIGAAADAPYRFGCWHAETEKQLEQSGLAWTHLRPSFFMTNTLMFAPTIARDGAFYTPTGDGQMGFIDVRDIAAVAVKTLIESGHESKTYTLTGPEALSHAQIAEKISTAIGTPVRFVNIAPDDFKKGALASGLPAWFADALNELYAMVRAGHMATVTGTVTQIAGRPPRTFDRFARDHADAFRAPSAP